MGDKVEHQGFAKMTMNGNNCKEHPRKVTIRIANKDPCGEPIVPPHAQGYTDKGKDEVEGEAILLHSLTRPDRGNVGEEYKGSDHQALPNLDSIDTGEDVDGMSAKDCKQGHVEIVQAAQIHQFTKDESQWQGNHHGRHSKGQ